MGIAYNTNIVRSGLVLHLDAANAKSWSQNVHPKPLDLYSWFVGTTGGCNISRDTSTATSPAGGVPLRMDVTGNDPYMAAHNGASYHLAPAANGQTWTVSVWVKGSVATTGEIFIFGDSAAGGSVFTINNYTAGVINVTTNWTRVSFSFTFTSALVERIQVRLDGPNSGGAGQTIWWDGLQVERNSSATPFNPICNTNGTSWQDLSGKKYSATLVGFPTYSNGALQFRTSTIQYATMQFDEGVLRQQNQTGQWSLETWFKYVSAPNSDESFIVGRAGCHGGIYLYGNANLYNAIKTTQCWTGAINLQVKTLAPNENIHSVMTYNNGVMKSYINGVYVGTSSLDLVNYPHLAYGTELLIGGTNSTMYRTNTDIYKISSYNRELSDVEVKQNFEALRGRYGI